jgi:tripartite-type tricarboxylate transporter receptor subunit TctC
MKLPRRKFLQLTAGAAALPAVARIARAQSYPTRPVRIVAPTAPGGADILARLIGPWLSGRLVIDNRPVLAPISAPKRSCVPQRTATLLLASTTNTINATLYDRLNFNFIRDIAPVAGIIRLPLVMVVNPSVPAKTVPEFTAHAKANPRKINLGSPGIGTPGHVAGELFKMMAGVDLVHVPYRGGGRG